MQHVDIIIHRDGHPMTLVIDSITNIFEIFKQVQGAGSRRAPALLPLLRLILFLFVSKLLAFPPSQCRVVSYLVQL